MRRTFWDYKVAMRHSQVKRPPLGPQISECVKQKEIKNVTKCDQNLIATHIRYKPIYSSMRRLAPTTKKFCVCLELYNSLHNRFEWFI